MLMVGFRRFFKKRKKKKVMIMGKRCVAWKTRVMHLHTHTNFFRVLTTKQIVVLTTYIFFFSHIHPLLLPPFPTTFKCHINLHLKIYQKNYHVIHVFKGNIEIGDKYFLWFLNLFFYLFSNKTLVCVYIIVHDEQNEFIIMCNIDKN